VMGRAFSPSPGTYPAMFKWTSPTGMIELGQAFHAVDMSADGSVAIGMSYNDGGPYGLNDTYRAKRWTASTGLVNMAPQQTFAHDRISAISSDGQAIVGSGGATSGPGESWVPFLWRESTGYTVLPGAPDATSTYALRISDDHATIAGTFSGPAGFHAYRWTLDGGYEDLGAHPEYPGGEYAILITAMSADGKIIVGRGDSFSAFIWDEHQGMMMTAQQYFLTHGIDVPEVNNLTVSRDGQNFFGTTNDGRAFIATVPEPASTVTLLLGLATVCARGRRRA
jgi:hypothetical protein